MDHSEWLTRGTVWLALTLYIAGELASGYASGPNRIKAARWLNGLGLAAFFGHVVCAFHFHHEWSHTVAYRDTAKQTAEFSGWNWGGGLYVNYLFTLVWFGEFTWPMLSPTTFARRSRWMDWAIRGFFMFMIFNGGVVFAKSPMRWYGLCLCTLLALAWCRRGKSRRVVLQPDPASPHE